jgi:hypothetical protein
MVTWFWHDGGRLYAGYKGHASDCAARAFAIGTGTPYTKVYERLNELTKECHGAHSLRRAGAARGISNVVAMKYMAEAGWAYKALPGGATFAHPELEQGRIIVDTPHHLVAVINGALYDTFDSAYTPKRRSARKILGYYYPKEVTPMEPVKEAPAAKVPKPKKVGRPFMPDNYEKRINFNLSLPPSEMEALRGLGFGSASQAVSKLLMLYLAEQSK